MAGGCSGVYSRKKFSDCFLMVHSGVLYILERRRGPKRRRARGNLPPYSLLSTGLINSVNGVSMSKPSRDVLVNVSFRVSDRFVSTRRFISKCAETRSSTYILKNSIQQSSVATLFYMWRKLRRHFCGKFLFKYQWKNFGNWSRFGKDNDKQCKGFVSFWYTYRV